LRKCTSQAVMFTFQFDDAREREKHARRVSHRFACKKFTVAYGEILVFGRPHI